MISGCFRGDVEEKIVATNFKLSENLYPDAPADITAIPKIAHMLGQDDAPIIDLDDFSSQISRLTSILISSSLKKTQKLISFSSAEEYHEGALVLEELHGRYISKFEDYTIESIVNMIKPCLRQLEYRKRIYGFINRLVRKVCVCTFIIHSFNLC